MPARPLAVGLDWLPARAHWPGVGRYARELGRALLRLEAAERAGGAAGGSAGTSEPPLETVLLELGRAPARVGEPALGLAELARAPRRVRLAWPRRALALAAAAGLDAARLGGVALVHQVRPFTGPPVRSAPETLALSELPPAGSAAEEALARRAARAATICVFSERGAQLARERLRLPPERVVTFPVGAEHWRRALGDPDERPRARSIVVLGAVAPGRGLQALLAALERLHAGGLDARLRVIGRPAAGEPLLRAALARSPVAASVERIEDPEAFGDLEVARAVERAGALACLDSDPLTAVTPLEGLALGTPLVCAPAPALREVLGEETRFLSAAGDAVEPAELADALADALLAADDPRGRALRLARAAPHTWERSARAHRLLWSRRLERA